MSFAFTFPLDAAAGLGGRCHRMSRHRRGFGGPPWGGPGGFGPSHHRRRMRRGDVRAAILVLLAEQPNNGYGLMQEVEDRSDGVWRPSPGSMYPALAQLEDEGLVVAEESGGSRRYTLTDAGTTYVADNREQLGEPWADLSSEIGASRLELRDLIGQLATAAIQVSQAGSDAQIAKAHEVLIDARKALYRLLAEE